MQRECFKYISDRIEAELNSSRTITEIHLPKSLYAEWQRLEYYPKYTSYGNDVLICPTESNCFATVRVFVKGTPTCALVFALPDAYVIEERLESSEPSIVDIVTETILRELVVSYTRLCSSRSSDEYEKHSGYIKHVKRKYMETDKRIRTMINYLEDNVMRV